MSDLKHTTEPWAHRNGRIYQADRDVLTIANIARASDGDYSEANARRIVAAVNYCAAMENVTMEYAVSVGLGAKEHLLRLAADRDDAERQRDQLLEALELADAMLSGANMNASVVEKKVKAAITAAKGEK